MITTYLTKRFLFQAAGTSFAVIALACLVGKRQITNLDKDNNIRHRSTRGKLRYLRGRNAVVPVNNILLLAVRLTRSGLSDLVHVEQLRSRLYLELHTVGLNFEAHLAHRREESRPVMTDEHLDTLRCALNKTYANAKYHDIVVNQAIDYVMSPEHLQDVELDLVLKYQAIMFGNSLRSGVVPGWVRTQWWYWKARIAHIMGWSLALPKA